MTGNQAKCFVLYQQYKDIMEGRENKLLQKYAIPISETLKKKLMEYNPNEK